MLKYILIISYICQIKAQMPKCWTVTDSSKCTENGCIQQYWGKQICQNKCTMVSGQSDCDEAVNCVWRENSCTYATCSSVTLSNHCKFIAGCEWSENKCWDSSCVTLQAKQVGQCPSNFCIWNDQRMLCYDKKCSDYSTQLTCNEISFCQWEKYKCIKNGNPTIQY